MLRFKSERVGNDLLNRKTGKITRDKNVNGWIFIFIQFHFFFDLQEIFCLQFMTNWICISFFVFLISVYINISQLLFTKRLFYSEIPRDTWCSANLFSNFFGVCRPLSLVCLKVASARISLLATVSSQDILRKTRSQQLNKKTEQNLINKLDSEYKTKRLES